jgi:hypothetical protein
MRLIDAGAGADSTYGGAAQTVALILTAKGDLPGAASALHTAVAYSERVGKQVYILSNIAFAVLLLAKAGDFDAAATLAGAADGSLNGDPILSPEHRRHRDEALRDAADALGPVAYAEARRRGAAMNYDEIIEFTLTHLAGLAGLG